MNPASLRSHKSKDLAQMARRAGVSGWHAMRKEELISALVSLQKKSGDLKIDELNGHSSKVNSHSHAGEVASRKPKKPPISRAKQRVSRKIAEMQEERQRLHDLSTEDKTSRDETADRLVLLVRDPYWLHACWELSIRSIERACTALGQEWHAAQPVLRAHRLSDEGAVISTKQIVIHGGVSNWYIDVTNPPSSYRSEIGYASPSGKFYCIARSNDVKTPAPGSENTIDENWNDVARNADRIYAMSGGYSPNGTSLELQEMLEERLRRRLGRPSATRFGNGASQPDEPSLRFTLDVELMVYGSADPNTHLTVQGEPITVQPDGGFMVKLPFPDRRQVIPIVATTAAGTEERTVILGVERNTKMLESTKRESPVR